MFQEFKSTHGTSTRDAIKFSDVCYISYSGPFDISYDNIFLVVCSVGHRVTVYNYQTAMAICELEYTEESWHFNPVLFSFDNSVLCVGTDEGAVRMWAVREKQEDMPPQFVYFEKCEYSGKRLLSNLDL